MTSPQTKQPLTTAELKHYAMGLLAGREYGAFELLQKLSKRSEAATAENVLAWLQEQNLQSDERYCQMLLRSKAQRGQGPMRIRQEMQHKRLAAGAIDLAFENYDGDWYQSALAAYEKKFRQPVGKDPKDRAKRMRFLQYRGFTSDQIHYALDQGHQGLAEQ